jgi:hypothetical protein
VWLFLAPALTRRERRAIVPALYMGVALFCVGVVVAYVYVLPLTAMFLAGFQTESLTLTMTGTLYFGFVIKLLVAFGLVFQLPVVILILATLGLVSSRFLASKRRYAVAGDDGHCRAHHPRRRGVDDPHDGAAAAPVRVQHHAHSSGRANRARHAAEDELAGEAADQAADAAPAEVP